MYDECLFLQFCVSEHHPQIHNKYIFQIKRNNHKLFANNKKILEKKTNKKTWNAMYVYSEKWAELSG